MQKKNKMTCRQANRQGEFPEIKSCCVGADYSWDPKNKNFLIIIMVSTSWIPRVHWYIFGKNLLIQDCVGKKNTDSWDPKSGSKK